MLLLDTVPVTMSPIRLLDLDDHLDLNRDIER